MRDFAAEKNVAQIRDGISGDVHEIYFRLPTNEERAAYQNGLFQRSGRKLLTRVLENRIKFGGRIIVGFKKGTIGINGQPFSSEPEDPAYREDWKNLLIQSAPDIVSAVAVTAFEGTGNVAAEVEIEVPLEE